MTGKKDMTGRKDGARGRGSDQQSAVAREIDENLKRVYQAALEEEVPDRFHQLLAKLREKEGKS